MSEKKFRLFDFNKNGKGVSKWDVDGPPNLANFFKKYKRKFSRLLSVNIFMVLGNFPLFFLGFAMAGYGAIDSTVQGHPIYHAVRTVALFNGSPVTDALHSVYGMQAPLTVNTTVTYLLYALSLLTLLTFGLTNVGTTYILRNLIKGDPVFMWSDFWYAVKRNWKQGILLGFMDCVASFLFAFNVGFYFKALDGGFANGLLFYISVAMVVLYFFMRFYMYILTVTFDLSLFKILKNSFIFAIIGFKRNIMATLGIILLVILNFIVFMYIPSLGIVLPMVVTLSNGAFMSTYAAWFKIKEIMIDPYEEKHEEPTEPPIATDDVTL